MVAGIAQSVKRQGTVWTAEESGGFELEVRPRDFLHSVQRPELEADYEWSYSFSPPHAPHHNMNVFIVSGEGYKL
jgi:hypothetical protein